MSVCTSGADDITGWFWLTNGAPFVAVNPQTDVCYAWDVPTSVVYFYPCDYKGCAPPTYV